MPGEQPLQIEWLLIRAGGIKQQFRETFGTRGDAPFFAQPQTSRQ